MPADAGLFSSGSSLPRTVPCCTPATDGDSPNLLIPVYLCSFLLVRSLSSHRSQLLPVTPSSLLQTFQALFLILLLIIFPLLHTSFPISTLGKLRLPHESPAQLAPLLCSLPVSFCRRNWLQSTLSTEPDCHSFTEVEQTM